MLPRRGPRELSTASDGEVFTRSLPSTWSIVKNSLLVLMGACHVAPLFSERAKPTMLPSPPNVPGNGNRRHATYALLLPAAKRGIDACPSSAVAATMAPADQVGGLPAFALSENAVRISTPPGAAGVKFDQLMISRPVSGSTSMNSLSAASAGSSSSTIPFGFVAAVISNGPCHVLPQSVERCRLIVCTAVVAENFLIMIDEYTNVHAPRYFTSGSPKTCGSRVVPITSLPGVGKRPPSTNVRPPSAEYSTPDNEIGFSLKPRVSL